jgi:hypothetical protein
LFIEGGHFMHRRSGPIIESLTVIASAAVAGIACCGSIVIQWLGLLVWAAGGRALLLGLVRYEIPILAVIAGASFLGRQLARDRLTRWTNTILASVALLFVVLLLIWHIRRGIVMAFDPVQLLFSYRQTVLLAAAGLLFAARLALLIAALWRRRRPVNACAST